MASKKNKKNKSHSNKNRSPRRAYSGMTARQADRHELYELSVQDTEATIELIEAIHSHHANCNPVSLREDFCGTAKLCADWVRSDNQRIALGIDNDPDPLAWGKAKHFSGLSDEQMSRVVLSQSDVRDKSNDSHDVVVAFNFSYWIFHQRQILLDYFRSVRASISEKGTFILDLHGGPDAQFKLEEESEKDGFTYVWEQELFDPINNAAQCHIHFRFPDGSSLPRAFSYDWRVWSIPELKDILKEAGFGTVHVWWDDEDDVYRPLESTGNIVSWIAYLAAHP